MNLSIAEKLRHLADMSDQDPSDLHRIAWRLDVLSDEIHQRIDANDAALIDALCRLDTTAIRRTD